MESGLGTNGYTIFLVGKKCKNGLWNSNYISAFIFISLYCMVEVIRYSLSGIVGTRDSDTAYIRIVMLGIVIFALVG